MAIISAHRQKGGLTWATVEGQHRATWAALDHTEGGPVLVWQGSDPYLWLLSFQAADKMIAEAVACNEPSLAEDYDQTITAFMLGRIS